MKPHLLLKVSCLAVAFALAPSAVFCGHMEGNGGDHIRGMFIKMGQAVTQYLQETTEGVALAKSHALDLPALTAALDINSIMVSSATLVDNGGSEVDAIGIPGSITLNKDRWVSYFENESDVYYLVFHEMLRSVAVDDDGYVVSSKVLPFPATRHVLTRISPTVPLIEEDELAGVVDLAHLAVAGSGCPTTLEGTVADFDLERNLLDISLRRFSLSAGGTSGKTLDRQTCNLAIPVLAPHGKRVVISQIDLSSKLDLGAGAQASFRLESFLAGSTGAVASRTVSATIAGKKGRSLMRSNDRLRSNCGGSDILRLNSSAVLAAGSAQNASTLAVSRLVLYLRLESCP